MGRLSENSVLNVKNKSHSVTAEIVVPDSGGKGVLIAQAMRRAMSAMTPARRSATTTRPGTATSTAS
jgi:arylsulfatase